VGNFSLFQGSDIRIVINTTSLQVRLLIEMITICQIMWYEEYLIRGTRKNGEASVSSLLKNLEFSRNVY
jgi:hypothetical protein